MVSWEYTFFLKGEKETSLFLNRIFLLLLEREIVFSSYFSISSFPIFYFR